jgi:hypothetical protein
MSSLVTGIEVDEQVRSSWIDAGGALRQAVKRIVKLNGHRSVLAVRNSTPFPD